MYDYTNVLKSILMNKKWVNNETTYIFTEIKNTEYYYDFNVDAKHETDITFLSCNLYDYVEKLIRSAFDVLDVDEAPIEINLKYFSPNQINSQTLNYGSYNISTKDKLKTLNKFNNIPIHGFIKKDENTDGYEIFKGISDDFNLLIDLAVKKIVFTFETKVKIKGYNSDKIERKNFINSEILNTQMSDFLIRTYEQKFLTPDNQDWALFSRAQIIL